MSAAFHPRLATLLLVVLLVQESAKMLPGADIRTDPMNHTRWEVLLTMLLSLPVASQDLRLFGR